jgi:ABC-2 type transport system ATP-binding protein
MNAIEIISLHKKYSNGKKALNGINLEIPKGSFFGLLGPNGAGKTTTIGILTGLVNPTSGKMKVFDFDPIKDFRETRKRIGLSSQEFNFDIFFTVEQILRLQAGYYGVPRKKTFERASIMLESFGLEDKKKSKPRELSGGMKRRLQIAKALVHDPPIIILDEPTAGIDVELRYKLWDYLNLINKEGKTILLTTHYIEEAEKLCDEIAIINNGKIIAQDKTDTLKNKIEQKEIILELSSSIHINDLCDYSFSMKDNTLIIKSLKVEADLPKIIEKINSKNINIKNIKINEPTLENVFLELTTNDK